LFSNGKGIPSQQAVQTQRQGDHPRSIESPRQQPAGSHRHGPRAVSTPVPPQLHLVKLRRAPGPKRSAELPAAQPMAPQSKGLPRGSAGRLARGAAGRPHRVGAGRFFMPPLDIQVALYNLALALVLPQFVFRSTTRQMLATSASSLLSISRRCPGLLGAPVYFVLLAWVHAYR
jgi:hypothetical protein